MTGGCGKLVKVIWRRCVPKRQSWIVACPRFCVTNAGVWLNDWKPRLVTMPTLMSLALHVGCHNDNLRCHKWRQSWHQGKSWFLEISRNNRILHVYMTAYSYKMICYHELMNCMKLMPAFNLLRPCGAYMLQQSKPSLVHIMACRLVGAKPLSEPMLWHC